MTGNGHSEIPLVPLNSLAVDVITDDVSDNYVSKTLFAVSEFANVVRAGATVLSGEALLVRQSRVWLPAGVERGRGAPYPPVRHRAGGGDLYPQLRQSRRGARRGRGDRGQPRPLGPYGRIAGGIGRDPRARAATATVHVNPGMFDERAIRLGSGTVVPAARVPSPAEMAALGAAVVNDPAARLLLGRHFYYSGEIPRVSAFEKGRVDHLSRTGPDAAWQPDPLLLDERMLVVHIRDLGLVVVSSCSHAGIVNVCTEVRRLFPDIPIHCVIGGLHLGGVMERLIPQTVEGLRPFAIAHIITGHCTGWRALHALANAFGDAVSQSAVGTSYNLRRPGTFLIGGIGTAGPFAERCDLLSLSPRRPGGEGGRRAARRAHLTLPSLRDGPLPLPLKGGEGVSGRSSTC